MSIFSNAGNVKLGELIRYLSRQDPKRVYPVGFEHPHSYRGYYEDVAFVPKKNATADMMLKAALDAIGSVFNGWKGGEFTMEDDTDCWLSEIGQCGVPIILKDSSDAPLILD